MLDTIGLLLESLVRLAVLGTDPEANSLIQGFFERDLALAHYFADESLDIRIQRNRGPHTLMIASSSMRSGCVEKAVHSCEDLLLNTRIIAETVKPDHVFLAAEPGDLALGVASSVLLRLKDGLVQIELAAQKL